ncbi:hypothetical protein CAMRE0001_3000 [Campylobacter rectus RM3267]|uniref:Uncharacterized protein n=1 Tax=Campylobacter rectus RM3267 TaxID=553218 RepID=B9D610_CAMRE|nr:hypothetical protein CAMRE0001_3000 [Campylobacter rectus RM3267]
MKYKFLYCVRHLNFKKLSIDNIYFYTLSLKIVLQIFKAI